MDNEILEGDAPVAKKRASRKTDTTKPRAPRKPRAKKNQEIPESYSASPDGLTCEYSNTVQLEVVEDWSPVSKSEKLPAENTNNSEASAEGEETESTATQSASSDRRYRRFRSDVENTNNSEASAEGEETESTAAQSASSDRRYRRFRSDVENINNSETSAEGEVTESTAAQPASNDRRYRRFRSDVENTNNSKVSAEGEVTESTAAQPASNDRRYRRFRSDVENINNSEASTEGEVTESTAAQPASNDRRYRRFQRLPRVAEQENTQNVKPRQKSTEPSAEVAQNNPAEYNRSRNDNFRNNARGPQQNNSPRNANRRRIGGTIRIGAFSIGYLRNLECLENYAKLSEFCQLVADESREPLNLNEVLEKSNDDLADFASSIDLDEASSRGKIIDNCIESAASEQRPVVVQGILESMEGGDGIITYGCDNYKIRAKSTFVPRCLIQTLGLRRGQTITAYVHSPMEQSTCPFAIKIKDVLGRAPEEAIKFPRFKDLTPYYPTERIFLEQSGDTSGNNLSMRVVDLLSPIGFGQRGLIVAPPRTGKTILLQGIANSIIHNQPKAKLIVLLIDERPEEVTDFSRQVKDAQVVSSTFDESAESHVHAAEIVIENARRWVEVGEHVIILLDSITRLARAYNTEQPSSGKVLSGGVEANALQLPKRFFGSARNIEGGGSLTIIATALVETGSRMDDVIFEEFKGTGNMELHLDRSISDKRIFPAINIELSGTRKEELLYHPDELVKIYSLRRAFQGVPPVDAMEMLSTRLKKFATNVEFLMNLNR